MLCVFFLDPVSAMAAIFAQFRNPMRPCLNLLICAFWTKQRLIALLERPPLNAGS